METISHSLITLLLNASWQVPLIVAVAALVCHLMRRGPAAHRHAVWVAAMWAAVLLPIASMWTAGRDSAGLRAIVPPADRVTGVTAALGPRSGTAPHASVTATVRTISYAPLTATLLLGIFAGFLLWRVAKLVSSWRRTTEIRSGASARAIPPHIDNVWRRCLAALGVDNVELLCSASVTGPVTAGARHNVVILPESMLAETSEDVLVAAIGHEMAHIARRDFGWKLVYEIVSMPVAFHPAMIVIRRGIEESREMACDELVTERLLERGAYARSIVRIAAGMAQLARPGYTLGVFDGDILEQRIRRLLAGASSNGKRARLVLASGLGVLAVSAVIASGLAVSARAQGDESSAMKAAHEASARGDYKAAVEAFENAVRLEPDNIRAKLSLASALEAEYFKVAADPSLPPRVRQQYLDVLARDPHNSEALEGMVTASIFSKQFAEAQDWVRKLLVDNPKDAAAYYTAGFLDWSIAYPSYTRARVAAGMPVQQQGMITDAALRQKLRSEIGSTIEDGFRMLQIALQLNPNDDNAMAYMNLLYRLRAAIADTDAEARDAVAKADEWVGKALAAKKANAHSGVAKQSEMRLAAPPPPPPPPPPNWPAARLDAPASALPLPGGGGDRGSTIKWQVTGWSVDGGEVSAKELIAALKAKGFDNVRVALGSDQLVRIFVGPFPDQPSADQMKGALEAAGFHVVRQW